MRLTTFGAQTRGVWVSPTRSRALAEQRLVENFMQTARSIFGLLVPAALATFACSSSSRSVPVDAAVLMPQVLAPRQFSASDTGQPATITGRHLGRGQLVSAQASLRHQQRVVHHPARLDEHASQGAGGGKLLHPVPGWIFVRRLSWNGTGRYDEDQHWVPSQTTFTAGLSRNRDLPGHDLG